MIKTFADRNTEVLFNTAESRKYPQDILIRAVTRLNWIDTASMVDDLEVPPSNHLEKLILKNLKVIGMDNIVLELITNTVFVLFLKTATHLMLK